MGLPAWAQGVVALSALVGAVALLWTKVLRPIIRIGAKTDDHETRLDDHEQRLQDLEDE